MSPELKGAPGACYSGKGTPENIKFNEKADNGELLVASIDGSNKQIFYPPDMEQSHVVATFYAETGTRETTAETYDSPSKKERAQIFCKKMLGKAGIKGAEE